MRVRDDWPIPAAGALICIGPFDAGDWIGQGFSAARPSDRDVTDQGLAERLVQADLAI